MTSDVNSGYLLIADISGYTKFLAETELAHAKGILEDLFDEMLADLKDSQIELDKSVKTMNEMAELLREP